MWGGNSLSKGVDCSGLVQQSYKKAGISVPRVAQDQYNKSKKISLNSMVPGDLVFFGKGKNNVTHVGIYMGNGKFIEAPRTGLNVRISNLSDRKDIVGAGRYF